MTVIVCTDQRGGMLFAGRRTSRDRKMLADLAALCAGHRLLCTPFSEALLRGAGLTPTVFCDCLAVAGDEDFVFVEDLPLAPHLSAIDRLILYTWDKVYPHDVALDVTPAAHFSSLGVTELSGHSHDCITREIFER